jgi:hypothetical protein
MSNLFNACDCSNNGLPQYRPCRVLSCGGDCSGNCPKTNIYLQSIEKRIQNQVRVHESQYIDVLGAVTIAGNYLDSSANTAPIVGSMTWGNRFNLRNQSDRRLPSGTTNYVNVPTRGNSTRSTITANKPGAMTPGGYGVDVKHGSYARYLGKLKGRTMAIGTSQNNAHPQPSVVSGCSYTGTKIPVCSSSMNNKSYRFTLVNTNNCLCNGSPILHV